MFAGIGNCVFFIFFSDLPPAVLMRNLCKVKCRGVKKLHGKEEESFVVLFVFFFCFCEEKVPAESRKHDVTVRSSPESQRIIQMFVQRELKLSFYLVWFYNFC